MGFTLYSLFSAPLEELIEAHGLKCAVYADDTQLYSTFKQDELSTVIPSLELCLNAVKDWSLANDLKINVDKTEILHLSSRYRKKIVLPTITFNDAPLNPIQCVRNLGVLFDDQLTMHNHVRNICQLSSYALHRIGKIRHYLDKTTTEKLVHAFVISRLDNCNSLLYGLPDSLLAKVQRIQNSAARLITRRKLFEHISPILYNLHWLPVKQRIIFKLMVIAFKCHHRIAPSTYKILLKCINHLEVSGHHQIPSSRHIPLILGDTGKEHFNVPFRNYGTCFLNI